MLDKENMNKIIDSYVLKFLDNYASTYGILPDTSLVEIWRLGFINGCQAVSDALIQNSLNSSYNYIMDICEDCEGKCSVCEPNSKQ